MACVICDHPERAAIDRALQAGASIRGVRRQFGTSLASTHRHARDHAQASGQAQATGAGTGKAAPRPSASKPLAIVEAVPVEGGADVEAVVHTTLARALAGLSAATTASDIATLVKAIVPAAKLLAELTGRLGAAPADRDWERMSPAELDAEALKVLERNPEFLTRVLAQKAG